MSDRVSNYSEEPEITGGWHAPKSGGGWHMPKASAASEAVWRRPTLPANVGAEPESAGAWHLPKPEDTSIPAASDVAAGVDEAVADVPDVEAAEAEAPVASDALGMLDGESLLGGDGGILSSLVGQVSLEADVEIESDVSALDDELSALEQAATDEMAAVTSDDGAAATGLTDAEKAMLGEAGESAASTMDAAEYARRALEELGDVAPDADTGAVESSDAAEYARRALEELGGAEAQPSQPPQTGYTPALSGEAKKFRDAEARIAALRGQFLSGFLTRDQFQQRLREEMVLDENQVWWMMGVESDKWYRFENDTWVPDTPPALGVAQTDPGDEIYLYPGMKNLTDSHVTEDTSPGEATSASAGSVGAAGLPGSTSDMPLPEPQPVNDPYATIPGRYATEDELPGAGATVPGATQRGSFYEDTVPTTPPIGPAGYTSIPDPRPADYVQDFEALDAEGEFYGRARREQKRSTARIAIIAAVLGLGGLFLIAALVTGIIILRYNSIVNEFEPQIVALANFEQEFHTVTIVDGAGNVIARLTSPEGGDRIQISLEDMSPYLIHAVVSIENERFYQDPGWDPIAIGRAFLQNAVSGEIESGASTITQQVARRLVLQNSDISAERKINEIIVAQEIGRRYDKNFILQLYLNEIFFGNQSFGVEAAANFYFNKSARDLNLPESAMLAGIIQNPALYNVVDNRPDAGVNNPRQLTFDRMNVVLEQMVDVGCLQFQHAPYLDAPFCVTQEDIDQSREQITDVVLREYEPRQFNVQFPHFVDFVRLQIAETFGETVMFQRGFTIHTTLNPEMQQFAQNALSNRVLELTTARVNTGAIMITDPATGAIRAMVGSPDFNNEAINGQFNNTLGWNQPGSAIKPIVYTAAFEGVDRNGNGLIELGEYLTPASILWDVPTNFGGFMPINFDREFHGPVSVRSALQNSYNVPAVKAYQFIGNEKFQDTARRMGLGFLDGAEFNLTTGIGSTDVRLFDMMEAYGTIANTGTFVPLRAIESITDVDDNPVELPPELRPAPQQNAIAPPVAALMQSILTDNAARAPEFGINNTLIIPGFGNRVAAKTGTSNDSRDLWTMGFTTNVVVGVWLGNVDNNPTSAQGGFAAASPLWNQVMSHVLQRVSSPAPFPGVAGIVPGTAAFNVCQPTGTLDTQDDPSCPGPVVSELFVEGQPPPPANQGFVQNLTVDAWTGKLANEFCPDHPIVRTFAAIDDQAAVAWLNTNAIGQQTAINLGLPVPLEFPPTEACAVGDQQPIVLLSQPTDGQTIADVQTITGAVSAPNLDRYQLEVAPLGASNSFGIIVDENGQPQGPFTSPPSGAGTTTLGRWDTRTVPNGSYILRLSIFSTNGGNITETVNVVVQNAAPTVAPPPPTAVPPPTAIPSGATPLPFQDLNATPTPTIDVFG
ncbi:MAG: hypothetical protein D6737_05820 [Chloroflexi bacterium]|nr:MAG: hypothetical protein D6737_05820 [Chloroflexota bacterium]